MAAVESKSAERKHIVLIHGMFMTPLSWERFRGHFEELGYRVSAPAWPGHDGDIEEVRAAAPEAMAGLGLEQITAHCERMLRELADPPILVGHSMGGLVTQILLDRGFGLAGVGIDPAPPKGVHRMTLSELKATFPVLRNPANRKKAVALTFEQFRYAFANTMSEEAARRVYDDYAVPETGRPLFQAALADFMRDAPTTVDYNNGGRKPLLLITGEQDHIVPATVTRSTFRKYRGSRAVTDFREFPGRSHMIYVEDGWQEVADFVHEWIARALLTAAAEAADERILVGGP